MTTINPVTPSPISTKTISYWDASHSRSMTLRHVGSLDTLTRGDELQHFFHSAWGAEIYPVHPDLSSVIDGDLGGRPDVNPYLVEARQILADTFELDAETNGGIFLYLAQICPAGRNEMKDTVRKLMVLTPKELPYARRGRLETLGLIFFRKAVWIRSAHRQMDGLDYTPENCMKAGAQIADFLERAMNDQVFEIVRRSPESESVYRGRGCTAGNVGNVGNSDNGDKGDLPIRGINAAWNILRQIDPGACFPEEDFENGKLIRWRGDEEFEFGLSGSLAMTATARTAATASMAATGLAVIPTNAMAFVRTAAMMPNCLLPEKKVRRRFWAYRVVRLGRGRYDIRNVIGCFNSCEEALEHAKRFFPGVHQLPVDEAEYARHKQIINSHVDHKVPADSSLRALWRAGKDEKSPSVVATSDSNRAA